MYGDFKLSVYYMPVILAELFIGGDDQLGLKFPYACFALRPFLLCLNLNFVSVEYALYNY